MCKRDGNYFSFFSECAIYQPDFIKKNLDWSQPGYLADTLASCLHLELFFSLGMEKLSSLPKNEEVVTPSGELNTNNFYFLQNSHLFFIGTLFSVRL